jgi:hypothetical protein
LDVVEVRPEQDRRYLAASEEFGAALERLGRANEADPDKRYDSIWSDPAREC